MRLQAVVPPPPQVLLDALASLGVKTDSDLLLSASPLDIFQKLPSGIVNLQEFNEFVSHVTRQAAAPGISADKMLAQEQAKAEAHDYYPEITTGIQCLDTLLGGLAPPRLIEVTGDRSSGKTALALQIVLRHLSSGHDVGALWMDTTGEFPADSISHLLESCKGQAASTALNRLQVALAFDVETASQVLDMLRSTLSADPSPPVVRCVVVDTITALLSPLLSSVSSQGHAVMTTFMRQLKALANDFSLTVFVINSTTRWTPHNPEPGFTSTPRKPALGPSFTFLTDTTLWLAKHETDKDDVTTEGTPHIAEIFRSRIVRSRTWCPFRIYRGVLVDQKLGGDQPR